MENKPIVGDQVITGNVYIGGAIEKVDDIHADKITPTFLILPEKTPVNAVASSLVLTSDNTDVADADTVTIGTTVYTFKDTLAAAYDVQRDGTTADTTMGNLIAAIDASGTEGVEYFAGTLEHPDAEAGALSTHAFTVTAKVSGVAGNAIATAEDSGHLSWAGDALFLAGGVDGTVGEANETCADASYFYHAIAANTVADANWRQVTLGVAY